MAQNTQTTSPASSSNLILVGTVAVAAAIAMGVIGYYTGGHVAPGNGTILDTQDDERPPIIVGNGGSVVIEAQLHPKGTGRGKIQPPPAGSNKYKHDDAIPGHMKPKGLDLTIFGSNTCASTHAYKKVTQLVVSYGADTTEANWLPITFDDVDATNGSDLTWALDSKETPQLNGLGFRLELQAGNPWYLRRAKFNEGSTPQQCDFANQTGDQAILIEQRKQ
jgi:hypothetical protein